MHLRSMATFDFSTLYTKIPHEKLLEVMNELVDFCFQGGTHEQLSLTKYGAKWVSKNNRSGLRFTRSMVKDALEYLMGNCNFTFGDKVFRQVIGIPMGSDPAPFIANLFWYYYKSKWVKNLKEDGLQKARRIHCIGFDGSNGIEIFVQSWCIDFCLSTLIFYVSFVSFPEKGGKALLLRINAHIINNCITFLKRQFAILNSML